MKMAGFKFRYAAFVRDVATMMSGKSVAAAIALITTPIVARLFEPGDFGVAAVFTSLVGITSNISTLSYGRAVVIPKSENEALDLFAFSYRVGALFCAAMLLVIAVIVILPVQPGLFELLGPWVWLLPVGTLLASAILTQESWLTRSRRFALISASLVAGNTAASGSRIAAGMISGTSVIGLIGGYLLGLVVRIIVQWKTCRLGLETAFRRLDFGSMRRIARQYSDFPILNAPADAILALGQNLPTLLFGTMFSPAIAGFYAMASRLTRVPVTIAGNAMRRVFLQRAAAIHNSGRTLGVPFLLASAGLFALGIVPFAIIWQFGTPLLTWLLGTGWAEAGEYVEIIAPWMFVLWVMAPCNAVFIVLRRQRFWLTLQSFLTLFRLGVFGIAFHTGAGPHWTLQAFVLVSVIGSAITMLITMVLATRSHPPVAGDGGAA